MKRELKVIVREQVVDVTVWLGNSGKFTEYTKQEARELRRQLDKLEQQGLI